MTDAEIIAKAKRQRWFPDVQPDWLIALIDLSERACRERDEARKTIELLRDELKIETLYNGKAQAEALAKALGACINAIDSMLPEDLALAQSWARAALAAWRDSK